MDSKQTNSDSAIMKNEAQAREEFSKLYEHMREENAREGGSIHKRELWEQFIENGIYESRFPTSASAWKMPRSTK